MQKNSILGVILASGFSKRMGENKLLMQFNGKKMCEHIFLATKNSNLSDVIVISRFDEIEELAKKYDITYVFNKNAHLGQSESVKLGVLNAKNYNAIMFFSADTPYITCDIINSMITAFNNKILALSYNEKLQNPVIFPENHYNELLMLSGDVGGKSVILKNDFETIDLDFQNVDFDTQDDFKKSNL